MTTTQSATVKVISGFSVLKDSGDALTVHGIPENSLFHRMGTSLCGESCYIRPGAIEDFADSLKNRIGFPCMRCAATASRI